MEIASDHARQFFSRSINNAEARGRRAKERARGKESEARRGDPECVMSDRTVRVRTVNAASRGGAGGAEECTVAMFDSAFSAPPRETLLYLFCIGSFSHSVWITSNSSYHSCPYARTRASFRKRYTGTSSFAPHVQAGLQIGHLW